MQYLSNIGAAQSLKRGTVYGSTGDSTAIGFDSSAAYGGVAIGKSATAGSYEIVIMGGDAGLKMPNLGIDTTVAETGQTLVWNDSLNYNSGSFEWKPAGPITEYRKPLSQTLYQHTNIWYGFNGYTNTQISSASFYDLNYAPVTPQAGDYIRLENSQVDGNPQPLNDGDHLIVYSDGYSIYIESPAPTGMQGTADMTLVSSSKSYAGIIFDKNSLSWKKYTNATSNPVDLTQVDLDISTL